MLTGNSIVNGLNIDFMPSAGSPLASGASFSGFSGFDAVSYVGAFGTDNWLAGWTNFDPENTAY
jgi:hypothetical protein